MKSINVKHAIEWVRLLSSLTTPLNVLSWLSKWWKWFSLTDWHEQVSWSNCKSDGQSFSSRHTQAHVFASQSFSGFWKTIWLEILAQVIMKSYFTFAHCSASAMFKHSHRHWFAINFCKLLQSDAFFLHWHLHFLCSFTLTETSPIACSLVPPVNFVFLIVTWMSDSSVGEHVVPVCAQHPPHCFTMMHDGK